MLLALISDSLCLVTDPDLCLPLPGYRPWILNLSASLLTPNSLSAWLLTLNSLSSWLLTLNSLALSSWLPAPSLSAWLLALISGSLFLVTCPVSLRLVTGPDLWLSLFLVTRPDLWLSLCLVTGPDLWPSLPCYWPWTFKISAWLLTLYKLSLAWLLP